MALACRQATQVLSGHCGLEAIGGQVDQVDLVAAGLGAADGGSCYTAEKLRRCGTFSANAMV